MAVDDIVRRSLERLTGNSDPSDRYVAGKTHPNIKPPKRRDGEGALSHYILDFYHDDKGEIMHVGSADKAQRAQLEGLGYKQGSYKFSVRLPDAKALSERQPLERITGGSYRGMKTPADKVLKQVADEWNDQYGFSENGAATSASAR